MKSRRPKGEADDANRAMWQLISDKNWEGIQQRLANREWNPNRPLGRDLHHPILQRNLELVKLLLARKPDVNKPFDWPTYLGSPQKAIHRFS
jgi:hypothetical protein